ncbi:RdgB/HAM1 family non-canonical purine NTP pyrophosphatase [Raineyella fluvialis]|uniref:dITP/XTP pyrophosphatase n=1 Tax=Raineyella fluvialis TaxID=2662261 RepID=A0A5Q2FE06_9ACTN|nr:RdgB/HAM1 family non-canonical purine NTP pyrophosphatase [Raineyella fluvialis]QGF25008.1 RdgB/HAM1 family non-canonical purine NTP pyrophosphatase [Raineyella fluvialis]
MLEKVVLATNNAKKLVELRRVLADTGLEIEVLGLGDFERYPEPAEDGATFDDNALIKARVAVEHTGLPALADDSGLEIDVLNKMPGVRSSRWAGPACDDDANLHLVLDQIEDVPEERRTARFVCSMALVLPDLAADPSGRTPGQDFLQRGEVEGRITRAPRGENGFGYDPIFQPLDETRTTAELTPDEKDAISHRGKAVRAMASFIKGLREHPERTD